LPESHAGHVNVVMIADDEIHGHVQSVLNVVIEGNVRQEGKLEQTGPALVRIRPDMLSEAPIAIELPVANRRVGEHGNDNRCQPHAGAKLRHGVFFVVVIDIRLHRGGLFHHALAESAHLGHIRTHDAITLLRYPFDLFQPADRLHAQTQENYIQRLRDFQQLANMLVKFSIGTVDAIAWLTAEFYLPAGLQGNLSGAAGQSDDMPGLFFRLPSEAFVQLPQNELDTPRPEIGNGFARFPVDTDLFILGPDAPTVASFSRVVEKSFQLFFFFNN